MDLGLIVGIIIGLTVLLAIVFAAFFLLTLLEAAFGFDDLEFDDNFDDADDNLLDENHHVKPLLGVVYPKEK